MIGKTKLIITNFTQALKEKFFLNKKSKNKKNNISIMAVLLWNKTINDIIKI